MTLYRSQPVTVEARQVDTYDHDGMCELVRWCRGFAVAQGDKVIGIPHENDTMLARHGDWIVRSPFGEFLVVSGAVFAATYEAVN